MDTIGKGSGSFCALNPQSGRENVLQFTTHQNPNNIFWSSAAKPLVWKRHALPQGQDHKVTLCENHATRWAFIARRQYAPRTARVSELLRAEVQSVCRSISNSTPRHARFCVRTTTGYRNRRHGCGIAPMQLYNISSDAKVIQGSALMAPADNTPEKLRR